MEKQKKSYNQETANLADLDLATKQARLGKYVFTPTYRAPEIMNKDKEMISLLELQSGDIYALGVSLFEMHFGKHPWYKASLLNPKAALEDYKNTTSETYSKIFPEPTEGCYVHVIWEMMHPNPSMRPSAKEAIEKVKSSFIVEEDN